jgi:hypothetical protein
MKVVLIILGSLATLTGCQGKSNSSRSEQESDAETTPSSQQAQASDSGGPYSWRNRWKADTIRNSGDPFAP